MPEREVLVGWEPLDPYLTEAYCARCDSFGHTELQVTGMWWCNNCWEWRQPLPRSLERIITQITADAHNLYTRNGAPMPEAITENDIQWCLQTYAMLAIGGVWGVPRSGLLFRKDETPFVLKLQDVMPYDSAMPGSAEELREYQRDDFQMIREAFGKAGISVQDPLDLLA